MYLWFYSSWCLLIPNFSRCPILFANLYLEVAVFYGNVSVLNASFFDMSHLLLQSPLCRGQPFRHFVDIDVQILTISCCLRLGPASFLQRVAPCLPFFCLMSQYFCSGTFARTVVRVHFEFRCATLPCDSAHRLLTVSSRIAIGVLCRRPPAAPGACRPSFDCHVFDVAVSQL